MSEHPAADGDEQHSQNEDDNDNILERAGDAVTGVVAKLGQMGAAFKQGLHDGRKDN